MAVSKAAPGSGSGVRAADRNGAAPAGDFTCIHLLMSRVKTAESEATDIIYNTFIITVLLQVHFNKFNVYICNKNHTVALNLKDLVGIQTLNI